MDWLTVGVLLVVGIQSVRLVYLECRLCWLKAQVRGLERENAWHVDRRANEAKGVEERADLESQIGF